MQVSTFYNIFEPKRNIQGKNIHVPAKNADFFQVMECIKACYWQRHVTEYLSGQRQKVQLPCFTPSGTFSRRSLSGLEKYSGIVSLDFDKVENLPALRGMVDAVPFTLASFLSPGRNGLKVFCMVNSDESLHYVAFDQLKNEYETWTGKKLQADKQCKDYSRLCFVSYDASAFLNKEAEIFHVKPPKPKEYITTDLLAPNEVAQYLIGFTQKNPRCNGFVSGQRNWFIYLLACNCNRYGLSYEETLELCISIYEQEADCDTPAQIRRTIKSGYYNNPNEHAKFRIPIQNQ